MTFAQSFNSSKPGLGATDWLKVSQPLSLVRVFRLEDPSIKIVLVLVKDVNLSLLWRRIRELDNARLGVAPRWS